MDKALGLDKPSNWPNSKMPKQYKGILGVHNAEYQEKGDKHKRYPVVYSVPVRKPAVSEVNELRL